MKYLIVGRHRIGFHEPGTTITPEQVTAAGGDPAHLIAAGHIIPRDDRPAAKAPKASPVPSTVEEQ